MPTIMATHAHAFWLVSPSNQLVDAHGGPLLSLDDVEHHVSREDALSDLLGL